MSNTTLDDKPDEEDGLSLIRESTTMHVNCDKENAPAKNVLNTQESTFTFKGDANDDTTKFEQRSICDTIDSEEPSRANERTTTNIQLNNGLLEEEPQMKLNIDKISTETFSVIENGLPDVSDRKTNSEVKEMVDNAAASEDKPYKCYICDKLFSRNSSLKCHIRLHLEGPANILRKGSARALGESFSYEIEVSPKHTLLERQDEAELKQNEDGLHECHLCSRTFESKRGLIRHIGYHNSFVEQHAKADDTGSDIDLSLVDDNVIDEVSELFECIHCGKGFKSARAMKIHSAHTHKGVRPEYADVMDLEAIVMNSEADDEDPKFKCDSCGRVFESRRAKSIHTAQAHKLNGIDSSMTDQINELFECVHCGKKFKSVRAMKIHSAHTHRELQQEEADELDLEAFIDTSESEDEEQFECDYCGRKFNSQRARSIHAVHAHKLSTKLLEEMKSKKHDVEEESTGFFECTFCDREFETAREINVHIISEHNDADSFQCVVCERRYESIKAYSDHAQGICGSARIQNGAYLYKCKECPKLFAHPKSMSRHVREHRLKEKLEQFNDVLRENADADDSGKSEEIELRNGEEQFKCAFCARSYPNVKALSGHMKKHNRPNGSITSPTKLPSSVNDSGQPEDTGEEIKLYPCQFCDRTFTSNAGYAGHMKVHKSLSSNCSVSTLPHSPSADRTLSEIGDDENLSDSEKTFLCRYCNKTFTSGAQLGGHMRHHAAVSKTNQDVFDSVHETVEDEVYKCDACNRTFTYLSELNRHTTNGCLRSNSTRKRQGDDVFKCEYCEQTFLLRCHLQKHMKSRCNAIDLRNESMEGALNGDVNDAPPSKRVRKSTFMNSMYEYEPLEYRKSSRKTLKEKCFSGEKERRLEQVRNHDSEELNDDDFDNYINLHVGEHFVIENQEGDEEHFIFEQYEDNEGYQCSECEETYRDKLQMIIHMSFHLNNKLPNGGYKSLVIKADSTLLAPFKCEFCEERFVNKKYRSRHLCKRHRDDILQCDICQKLFLYKNTLRRHCKEHMIDMKYPCEYCRKCFTSKWFLKRHMRRHCVKRLASIELKQPETKDVPTLDSNQDCVKENMKTENSNSEVIEDNFIKEELQVDENIVIEDDELMKEEMPSRVIMHVQMRPV